MESKEEQLPTYEAVVEHIVDVNELEKKAPPVPSKDNQESSVHSPKGKGSSINFFGLFTTGSLTDYHDVLYSSGLVETFKLRVQPYANIEVFFEEIKAIQVEYNIPSKPEIKHSCEMKGTKFVVEISAARGIVTNWFSPQAGQVTIRLPTFFKLNIDFEVCGTVDWKGSPTLLQDVDIKTLAGKIRIDSMYANTIDISSSGGSITLDNATCSKLKVESSGGRIESSNVTADNIKVKSSAGTIDCIEYKATNDVEIKCSAGSIKAQVDFVKNAKGEIDIHSSAGAIQAIITGYKDLKIKSSAGSVKAELIPNESSKTKLSSSAGSVSANVKNFRGSHDCKASAGSATVRRNGMPLAPDNQIPPGSSKLDAHSSAGSVKVNFEY